MYITIPIILLEVPRLTYYVWNILKYILESSSIIIIHLNFNLIYKTKLYFNLIFVF